MSTSFERLRTLFERALDVPTAERAGFLERECGSDPELRQQVEALLAKDRDGGGFAMLLDGSASALVGRRDIEARGGR